MEIDLRQIETSYELHRILKEKLCFPNFYGMNWDAFWDAITGLVELPSKIVFVGWERMREILPEDSEICKNLFEEYNKKYGIPYNNYCEIVYS